MTPESVSLLMAYTDALGEEVACTSKDPAVLRKAAAATDATARQLKRYIMRLEKIAAAATAVDYCLKEGCVELVQAHNDLREALA